MNFTPFIQTTEGGWGTNGLSDPDMQAAWIAHYEILQAGLSASNLLVFQDWFSWGKVPSGTIETSTGTPTQAGYAYNVVYTWLVGQQPQPCANDDGNIWSCVVGNNLIVWDTSQTCGNGVCTTSPYTPPAGYSQYVDITSTNSLIVDTIDLGVKPENTFVVTNGDVVELDGYGARLGNRVPSGVVYVDGLGVGDVSESVMRDRWSIGSDGIFLVVVSIDRQTAQLVSGPDIVTKGFVPEENAADLADRVRQRVIDGLAEVQSGEHLAEVATIRDTIHDTVSSYLYERTKRRPMVLPVIMQV